tara:strand:- start:1073 stop:1927 length:855 start_codon:yes stop_codon:yes gene_type:complete
MNKYEQLIEYIINEDEDKAKALFHDIVVEKSRDIYETLIDEETFDESIGGNEVEDLVDEIQADETDGIPEDAEEDMDAEEEMMGGNDEVDAELGGEVDLEDKVMDLEKELDELKAEFDALMSDEMDEPEHADMDMDMDASDVEVDDNEAEELQMYEAHDEDEDEDKMDKTVEESAKPRATYAKTAVDLMREYVEKVAMPTGEDNKAVSPVAGKNNMGGKAVNFDAGSTTDPDGTGAPKEGKVDKMPHAGNYQNVPGAKANLSKATGAKNTQEPGVNTKAVQGDK